MKPLTDFAGLTLAWLVLLTPTLLFFLIISAVGEGLYWSMQFFTQ